MNKLAIIYAGGGASGKSTTSKAFCKGKPEQYKEMIEVETQKGFRPMKVCWTIYDNCALAGSHKSGTDSNSGPGALKASFFKCLNERDVVLVDGRIHTPKWVLMCNDYQNENPDIKLRVLCMHFNLTPEDLIIRLAERRGVKVDDDFRKLRFEDSVRQLRSAEILVGHFETKCEVGWEYLQIFSDDNTETIVELMNEVVREII